MLYAVIVASEIAFWSLLVGRPVRPLRARSPARRRGHAAGRRLHRPRSSCSSPPLDLAGGATAQTSHVFAAADRRLLGRLRAPPRRDRRPLRPAPARARGAPSRRAAEGRARARRLVPPRPHVGARRAAARRVLRCSAGEGDALAAAPGSGPRSWRSTSSCRSRTRSAGSGNVNCGWVGRRRIGPPVVPGAFTGICRLKAPRGLAERPAPSPPHPAGVRPAASVDLTQPPRHRRARQPIQPPLPRARRTPRRVHPRLRPEPEHVLHLHHRHPRRRGVGEPDQRPVRLALAHARGVDRLLDLEPHLGRQRRVPAQHRVVVVRARVDDGVLAVVRRRVHVPRVARRRSRTGARPCPGSPSDGAQPLDRPR